MPISSSSSGGPGPLCDFQPSAGTGFSAYGTVQVGSNGAAGGQPEVLCGGSGGNPATGRKTWDTNLADGFDTGRVSVSLTATAGGGGGVQFSVDGANPNPVVFNNAAYGTIKKVQVVASVSRAGAKVTWEQIVVKYSYTNGPDEIDPIPDECQPTASGTSASQVVESTPDGLPVSVVVTGLVQMQCTGTTLPNPTDLLGQILVFG